MLKIGVTGGIGSGKTTVCRVFEVLNVPVYYSDQRTKEIMAENEMLKNELISAFGDQVYNEKGILNTAYLASVVFNDQQKLNILNNLVHPYVLIDFETWCKKQQNQKYIILESAIIYESGIENLLDDVIVIDAPIETRYKRIIDRDKASAEEVRQRIDKQMPSGEKLKLADHIIFNDGKRSIIDQILLLHREFSGL
jgi:dephospho-CoA kinase